MEPVVAVDNEQSVDSQMIEHPPPVDDLVYPSLPDYKPLVFSQQAAP